MADETLTLNWRRESGPTTTATVTVSGEGDQNIEVAVPGSTTDYHVLASIDVSQLALIYILADKALTLKTNSTSTPADTISLAVDKPFLWYSGCGLTMPFTVDITTLYLTNGTAGTGNVELHFQYDATP